MTQMKKVFPATLLLGALFALNPSPVNAAFPLQGSDTLFGVMGDAIRLSGMSAELAYVGGGSGMGEEALVGGSQGIAPMSRELKHEAVEKGKTRGVAFVTRVIGLDGVGVFVNVGNATVGMDLSLLQKVFTCTVTDWRDIPGANRSGRINAYRRDDKSGTTDTFKTLVGIVKFGDCVQVVAENSDIGAVTGRDPFAIGFAGHAAANPKSKALSIARAPGQPLVELNAANVRNFSYPLSRKLFVVEATGAQKPNAAEAQFLRKVLDRNFLDPILRSHEFYTIN